MSSDETHRTGDRGDRGDMPAATRAETLYRSSSFFGLSRSNAGGRGTAVSHACPRRPRRPLLPTWENGSSAGTVKKQARKP